MNRLWAGLFCVIVLIPVALYGFRVFNFVESERKTAEYETLADQNSVV